MDSFDLRGFGEADEPAIAAAPGPPGALVEIGRVLEIGGGGARLALDMALAG